MYRLSATDTNGVIIFVDLECSIKEYKKAISHTFCFGLGLVYGV